LIHQFLHPHINNREDEFGINTQSGIGDNFLRKIIISIREKCGKKFPILLKISASDTLTNPFSIYNFIKLIKILDEIKVSAIEVSFGTMENALNIFRGESIPLDIILKHNFHYRDDGKMINMLWKFFVTPFLKMKLINFSRMYNLKYAKIATKLTDIPIICVGGFRKGDEITKVIKNGSTNYVSLSRPFICEPDFMEKLKCNPEYVSLCRNCNICAIMCDSEFGTRCYLSNEKLTLQNRTI